MARTVVCFEGTHTFSHYVLEGDITRNDIREACDSAWEGARTQDVAPVLKEAIAGEAWDKWNLRFQVIRDETPVGNDFVSICAPSYEYRYWYLGVEDYETGVELLLCAEAFIKENKPSRVKVVRLHETVTNALFNLNRKEEEE